MVLNYIIQLKRNAKQSVGKAKRGCKLCQRLFAGLQKTFLDFNEIMLNWKKIAKYCPEEVTNNLRAYTREEIAKLLAVLQQSRVELEYSLVNSELILQFQKLWNKMNKDDQTETAIESSTLAKTLVVYVHSQNKKEIKEPESLFYFWN